MLAKELISKQRYFHEYQDPYGDKYFFGGSYKVTNIDDQDQCVSFYFESNMAIHINLGASFIYSGSKVLLQMYRIGSQTDSEIDLQVTCMKKNIVVQFQRKRLDGYNQYRIIMNDY